MRACAVIQNSDYRRTLNSQQRVKCECVCAVMYIFNFHATLHAKYVPELVPSMLKTAYLKGMGCMVQPAAFTMPLLPFHNAPDTLSQCP